MNRLFQQYGWLVVTLVACADDPAGARCQSRGVVLEGQGDACRYDVGASGADAVLAVGREDHLFVSPGPGRTYYRSDDLGRSFAPHDPGGDVDAAGEWLHPYIHRDSASGRLFMNRFHVSTGAPGCANNSGTMLWWSDDDGEHWTASSVGCGSFDWGKVITGPAATPAQAAALAASGYPSMVYLCTTGPTLIVGPDHMCFRSSDGGLSFEQTGGLAAELVDNLGLFPIAFPQAGAVASNGTIYKSHAAPEGVAIKISTDGGDTWTKRSVRGSALAGAYTNFLSSNLTLAQDDTLYVTWIDDRDQLVRLSVSRDRTQTWTDPLVVSPAEVKHAAYPNLSVFDDGLVAIAYYGSGETQGSGDGYAVSDGRSYNAYLTLLRDLDAQAPVRITARINAAESPVITGLSFAVSEYLGPPQRTSDGSIWAAYVNQGQAVLGRILVE